MDDLPINDSQTHWLLNQSFKIIVGLVGFIGLILTIIGKFLFKKNEKHNDALGEAILKQNEDWNKKFADVKQEISGQGAQLTDLKITMATVEAIQIKMQEDIQEIKNSHAMRINFYEQLNDIKNLILRQT